MADGELNEKQALFVTEYLIDLNATQAAIRAGYSARTAHSQGPRLLEHVGVRRAITKLQAAVSEKAQVTAEYVLQSIVDTMERCKQAVPVYNQKGEPVMTETPDGGLAQAYVFNAAGVLKGAELLGKHLKMFTEKVEVKREDEPQELRITAEEARNILVDRLREAIELRPRLEAPMKRAKVIEG